ncbi:hypothetical protein V2J09_002440 [Rumex salicifolius]
MQYFVSPTPIDLEITVLSVDSLVMPNKRRKKNSVHVSVCVDSDPSTWQSTSTVDVARGETSATWNERLKVTGVSSSVAFEVRQSRKSMLTGKSKRVAICSADVPVSELVEGHVARDCVRFLSYRLRDRDGEDSGIVNFSIRVKGLDRDGNRGRSLLPELGVPRWQAGGGGVVVGVPAACL